MKAIEQYSRANDTRNIVVEHSLQLVVPHALTLYPSARALLKLGVLFKSKEPGQSMRKPAETSLQGDTSDVETTYVDLG